MKRSEHKAKKSIYKGVYANVVNNNRAMWAARKKHKYVSKISHHETEREAAIAYDRMCIDFGLPPVNILKPNKI